MEEIFSEGQRRVREKHVSLPYHRPKKHSLDDFLKRRSLVAAVPLRRPTHELQEVWKQIEEKEKDAEEFYKSEEESDDSEDEDYDPVKEDGHNDSHSQTAVDKENASVEKEKGSVDTENASIDKEIASVGKENASIDEENAVNENDMNVTNAERSEEISQSKANNDESSPNKDSGGDQADGTLDKENTDTFSLRLTESCHEPNSVEDATLENSDQFSLKLPDTNEFSQEPNEISIAHSSNAIASAIGEVKFNISDDSNADASSSPTEPNLKQIAEKAFDVAADIIDSESDKMNKTQDSVESPEDKNLNSSCKKLFKSPEKSEPSVKKFSEEQAQQSSEPLPESDPTFSLHLEESQDGCGNQANADDATMKGNATTKENSNSNEKESEEKIDWMNLKGFSDDDDFEMEEAPRKITIKRGPEDMILLDDSIKPSHAGVEKLKDQFCKHFSYKNVAKNKKKSVPLNIVTASKNEDNKIDGFSTETLSVTVDEEVSAGPKNEKPGAKLTKLQSTLLELMAKRREEDWKKRLQEHRVNEEDEDNDDEKSECGALLDDDEDFRPHATESEESDLEENDIDLTDKKKTKSAFVDDEADEDEDEDEDDDKGEDKHEGEESDLENEGNDEDRTKKPCKKKDVSEDEDYDGDDDINNDDDDSDDEKNKADNDDDDWLQPGQTKMRSQSSLTALTNDLPNKTDDMEFNDSKFDDFKFNDSKLNFSFDFNKFENSACDSETNLTSNLEVSGLEALINVKTTTNISESQVLQLCSGQFQTQPPQVEEEDDNFVLSPSQEESRSQDAVAKSCDPLLSSSDEENDLDLTRKRRKKTALKISDDEDEPDKLGTEDENLKGLVEENENSKDIIDEDENSKGVVDEEDGASDIEKEDIFSDIEENDDNVSVMYDSEENEIPVNKKDVAQYFDKEAELSDSEYDSEDEDEKGLDRMDEELGDQDQFDDDEVQKELGKIHMRNVLDDDQRQIKLLQDRFLEDGELHSEGKGREKNFKWRSDEAALEAAWRSRRNSDCEDVEEEEEGQEESDQLWRKMRQEKEAFLKKNKLSLSRDDEDLDETKALQFMSVTAKFKQSTFKKPEPMKMIDLDEPLLEKDCSPATILQTTNPMFHPRKGSFLSRSNQILSRVGPISAGGNAESKINQKTKKSRMIFTTVSPTKADAEESQDSNPDGKRKSAPISREANKKFKLDEDKKTVRTNRRSLLAQLTSF